MRKLMILGTFALSLIAMCAASTVTNACCPASDQVAIFDATVEVVDFDVNMSVPCEMDVYINNHLYPYSVIVEPNVLFQNRKKTGYAYYKPDRISESANYRKNTISVRLLTKSYINEYYGLSKDLSNIELLNSHNIHKATFSYKYIALQKYWCYDGLKNHLSTHLRGEVLNKATFSYKYIGLQKYWC